MLGKTVPLAFHLCCFYFSTALTVGGPFPFGVEDRMWNSIVPVPDHCLFIYFNAILLTKQNVHIYGPINIMLI